MDEHEQDVPMRGFAEGEVTAVLKDVSQRDGVREESWTNFVDYKILVRHKSGFSWIAQQPESKIRSVHTTLRSVLGAALNLPFPSAPKAKMVRHIFSNDTIEEDQLWARLCAMQEFLEKLLGAPGVIETPLVGGELLQVERLPEPDL